MKKERRGWWGLSFEAERKREEKKASCSFSPFLLYASAVVPLYRISRGHNAELQRERGLQNALFASSLEREQKSYDSRALFFFFSFSFP